MSSHLYRDENLCVADMLRLIDWPVERAGRVSAHAADLIRHVRAERRKSAGIEGFFQQYALSTAEGVALMCLAEALLRIPDSATAAALIRDKVAGTKWLKGQEDADWMTRAAGLGLTITSGTMNSLFSRLGEPVVRAAMAQAMKILGGQFVVGQTLKDAQKSARKLESGGYRLSYDMLGEGARTARDAAHYFAGYATAIEELDTDRGEGLTPGISVKLSALHPRYDVSQADRCVPELAEKLIHLCRLAAKKNIRLTVDAEETERFEISLDIIARAAADSETAGWAGLGLAVQAYQKRALPLVDRVLEMARRHDRKLQVRLVKGAYWDSEIKKAQVRGFPDYAVFTRKANTDLSYLVCAQKMMAARHLTYPMFGTHNAHTVAAVLDMAGDDKTGFEFQKLFGMGDALYAEVSEKRLAPVTIYAPVGVHQDLLPYLVRRLLENGANSSFVNKVFDKTIPPEELAGDPVAAVRAHHVHAHPSLPKPENLFGVGRANSRGIDLNDRPAREALSARMHESITLGFAAPIIGGRMAASKGPLDCFNPARTTEKIGSVVYAAEHQIDEAFKLARTGYTIWSSVPAAARADILNRAADLMEDHKAALMALCVREAGKTIPDALAEVREAVDFCRYYAAEGRKVLDEKGVALPGPTGEMNVIRMEPRGVFVAISPWNFPLAIFTGQVMAALMAGNAVIAKPAEQTSIIACEAVKLFHKAGVPAPALHLLPGDGRIGAALVAHPDVAGVVFTGSTEAAGSINRTLAAKDSAIVPLIAETGGQNAMIMDSSALPEQVVDDVVLSAFGSTGQRCSACRVLYVQEDVAAKTLEMLKGAMAELRVGDPQFYATDIGPVIDEPALAALIRHRARLEGFGKLIAQTPLPDELKQRGTFFAPIAYEIPGLQYLEREVFGPVLHVIRYRAEDIDAVIADINKTGYGLTLGVHTRIDAFARKIAGAVRCGNVYVNRSMIGAVVGVQPFGGMGLSGTGPKAGGPHYLARFATEKVISTNTAAAGGNASLVMMGD
jgi:RHH-type proline utilization regulon transcriptional repressor/proline dehydrogenase/delta 1-pyrroline-5-carboxylate dehydrogenase